MSTATHSIWFTGRLIGDETMVSRFAALQRLFPHADDEKIGHFFAGHRLLLAHGEPPEMAHRLAAALRAQGLECEVVPDPAAPGEVPLPHAQPAAHLRRPLSEAEPAPEHPLPEYHEGEADRFTLRGRRWALGSAIAGLAIVSFATTFALWQQLGGPALATDAAAIPTLCSVEERASLLGSSATYTLRCAASTAEGRYRLVLACTPPGAVTAQLALFDAHGRPRAPDWTRGALTLRYSLTGAETYSVPLAATRHANVGRIVGLDARALSALLASETLPLGGVFPGESARFELGAARWYVDFFVSGCRIS